MSLILKIFYMIYLPLFVDRGSTIYVDPYRQWYAIYYSDINRWVFKDGDYLR